MCDLIEMTNPAGSVEKIRKEDAQYWLNLGYNYAPAKKEEIKNVQENQEKQKVKKVKEVNKTDAAKEAS